MSKNRIELFKKRYGPAAVFILHSRETNSVLPWSQAYHNIRGRCLNPRANKFEYYGGRRVLCLVKPNDLKLAFMRDKAYLMRQPSVDRTDPDQDYTPDNITWIEMAANRKKRGLAHPSRQAIYSRLKVRVVELLNGAGWTQAYLHRMFFRRLLSDLRTPRK